MKDFKINIGNIIWIIGIIFTMGMAYSQIAQLGEDIEISTRPKVGLNTQISQTSASVSASIAIT